MDQIDRHDADPGKFNATPTLKPYPSTTSLICTTGAMSV